MNPLLKAELEARIALLKTQEPELWIAVQQKEKEAEPINKEVARIRKQWSEAYGEIQILQDFLAKGGAK